MAMRIDGLDLLTDGGSSFGNGGGGGIGLTNSGVSVVPPLVGENKPTQQFDLSVIANLRGTDKYLGRNLVNDIREAYQTYITGSPVGRGGQYAVDAARRYGTTITEAARGYLVAAGLPTLASILPDTGGNTGGGGNGNTGGGGNGNTDTNKKIDDLSKKVDEQIKKIEETVKSNNTVKILADQIEKLFGVGQLLPNLQSQATGYTPVTADSPIYGGGSGGSSIGLFIILGVVGVIGYFVYKRYAS